MRLAPVEVAYETYGTLAPDASNVVFVCHALTGDAHAAGFHADAERPGWWDVLIGPGKPLDTDRLFVVSPNLLGGCKGTTGPSSVDPSSGNAYGLRFPHFEVADLVAVHRRLLRHLGITRLRGAIGGSLGGMQVLQWALDFPDEIDDAILVCASARLSAQNIAFSAVARASIMNDENFQGGDYYGTGRSPDVGLAVARMLAHITYVSEESLERKFARRRRQPGPPTFEIDFEVESYLEYQGASFLERFDANTYLYLSRVMDYFDPFGAGLSPEGQSLQGQSLSRALESRSRFLVVSFDTDWRFPTAHSRVIADRLAWSGIEVEAVEISSPWGHDSFLLDVPDYLAAVANRLT